MKKHLSTVVLFAALAMFIDLAFQASPELFPGAMELHDRSSLTSQPRAGAWLREDGKIRCEGYLTSFESDGFCSELPSESATPLEFEGEVFFLQQLATTSE